MPPADRPARSGRARAAVPAVVGIGALVVLAAATGLPWSISDRFRLFSDGPSYRPVTPAPQPVATGTPPPLVDHGPSNLVTTVLWALLVLAVLVLAFWVWRVLPRRPPRAQVAGETGAHVLGRPVEPSAPAVREGVGTAQHLLDTVADPTDAVLAAWVALEEAAARSGVPRRPADTPTEFTARVLTATEADAAAVTSLLGLYHRARFSTAGVEPAAVVEARRCLDVLAGSWSRFSATAARTPDRTPDGPG